MCRRVNYTLRAVVILLFLGAWNSYAVDFKGFSTDFSRSTIDFSEVIAGGPPKDGIPAIDSPNFVSTAAAAGWIAEREPVLLIRRRHRTTANEEVKIYPLQILMWHEIVNDTIAGESVVVTYCPLCNTGVAFLSTVDGEPLSFGVSGLLRYSNMIMYDRKTESWWQQATGEAVAGLHTGKRLEMVPALTVSFGQAKASFPGAKVLSRVTGHIRPYGTNPYEGYDSRETPFLYRGPDTGPGLGMLEQVIMVQEGDEHQAVSYSRLMQERAVHFVLQERPIVVLWVPGTVSALDSRRIAEGRDIGSANAFYAELDGLPLSFAYKDGVFVDSVSKTSWNGLGEAVEGRMKGSSLDPAPAVQHFWFSYNAFSQDLDRGGS